MIKDPKKIEIAQVFTRIKRIKGKLMMEVE